MMRKKVTGTNATAIDARTKPQRVSPHPTFRPGQIGGGPVHGGGGPENVGATPVQTAGATKRQTQPSWKFEFENDFIGFAGPSTVPDNSGIPANNFRALGDTFGGRG